MTRPKPTKPTAEMVERDAPLRVVGIDLGTTNSTIAEVHWEPGGPVTLRCVEVEQPTLEGAYTHVLSHVGGVEATAVEGVGERTEDRAHQAVLRLARVQEIAVEERLEHLLENGGGESRARQLQRPVADADLDRDRLL